MTAKPNTEDSGSTASVRNVVVYSCAILAMPIIGEQIGEFLQIWRHSILLFPIAFLIAMRVVTSTAQKLLRAHIVDDVAKLCSSLAIMEQGEVVADGTVDDLLDAFRGRIWAKLVEPGEVAAYRSKYHVISSRLTAGRRTIEVLARKVLETASRRRPLISSTSTSPRWPTGGRT